MANTIVHCHASPRVVRDPGASGEQDGPHLLRAADPELPYDYPSRQWELDASGQPTNKVLPERRKVALITPIPKPKKSSAGRPKMVFDEAAQALGTEAQQ